MTFSAWMPIIASGAPNPPLPFARFYPGFSPYDPGWQQPAWRYDRASGEVEYRGLVRTDGTVPATSAAMVDCVMDATPALPRPPGPQMFMGMTSYGNGNNEVVRLDMTTNNPAAHHTISVEMTGGIVATAGQWFWLGHIRASMSDSNPEFGKWYGAGQEDPNGAYFYYQPQFFDHGHGWMPVQWRADKNYNHFQWRGLMVNSASALGQYPPYVPILNIEHPSPHQDVDGNILNTAIGHFVWSGGQAGSLRLDVARPAVGFAGGHRLHYVGSKAVTNVWDPLNLDYYLRPFA